MGKLQKQGIRLAAWFGVGFACSLIIATAASAPLFDSNCAKFAQGRDYVRGTLDEEKGTERLFVYDNLLPGYQKVISQVNSAIAPTSAPSSTCAGDSNLDACLGFQAYCTETIATAALKEDLHKWQVAVENCSNPKYFEKYPKHCETDTLKNLQYVRDQALWFGKAASTKSPAAAQFFQQASAEFGAYAGKLAELIKKKKNEAEYAGQLAKTQKFLNACSAVVQVDDNDVKGRGLAGQFSKNVASCSVNGGASSDTSQIGIAQFTKQLDSIDDVARSQDLAYQVESMALNKSARALWATSLMTTGGWDPGSATGEAQALQLICKSGPALCLDPEKKNIIKSAFVEFKIAVKAHPIKKMELSDQTNSLETELKPAIQKINASCGAIQKKAEALKAKYSCALVSTFKLVNGKLAPAPQQPPQEKMTMDKCEQLQAQWYADAKVLERESAPGLTSDNEDLLGGKLGHLFITDEFRNNVGELGPDFTYKQCMIGKGRIYKTPTGPQLKSATSQFYQLNVDEVKKISNEFSAKNSKEKNTDILKQYIKTNPLAISELLEKNPNPEFAKTLCQLIRDINHSDKVHQVIETTVAGAGFVASVALGATGLGAPATPFIMAAVTATTAEGVRSAAVDYLDAGHQSSLIKQSASTNQIELTHALGELRKMDEQKESSVEYMILTIGPEVAGYTLGKVLTSIKALKSAESTLKWIETVAVKAEWSAQDLKVVSQGLQRFQDSSAALGAEAKVMTALSNKLTQEELLELGAVYSKLTPSEAASLTSQISKEANASSLKKFIAEVAANPGKYLIKGKAQISALEKAAKDASALTLPNGESLTPFLAKIDDSIGKVNRLNDERDRLAKADKILGRSLNQAEQKSILEAHYIGVGETGKDGAAASLGNYNFGQIRQKVEALQTAGFSKDEIKILMEQNVTGMDTFMAGFFKSSKPKAKVAAAENSIVVENVKIGVFTSQEDAIKAMGHPVAYGPNGEVLKPDGFGHLFHGAEITPEEVKKAGMIPGKNPENPSLNLHDHAVNKLDPVTGKPVSTFRGTTEMISSPGGGSGAAYWADEGGWVYELDGVPHWNVNAHLEGKVKKLDGTGFQGNAMAGETEFAVSSNIPIECIKRWGQVSAASSGALKVNASAWEINGLYDAAKCAEHLPVNYFVDHQAFRAPQAGP